ncbi:MAG: single-stranded DNA-binding protein [Sorangiineae bacterium PRO1]|nr:single-stranded DNA-binding protein [Sorangiineae bacterium PRO1]
MERNEIMSDGINQVFLMGNLGSEPELRTLPSGANLLKFRMATNESYLDKNKERQTRTEWHDVVMWGNRAEPLSRILSKGSRVMVEGTLRTTSYEKDGVRRWHTEITARDLHLLGSRRSSSEPGDGSWLSDTEPVQALDGAVGF